MILQPYSDTIVSLLCFSSRSFALWSTLVDSNDPLYAFCPLVAYWQSFEQSLQNESEPEVEISRNHIITWKPKNRTMSKPFFLICHTMLETVFNEKLSDCIETFSVLTRSTVSVCLFLSLIPCLKPSSIRYCEHCNVT